MTNDLDLLKAGMNGAAAQGQVVVLSPCLKGDTSTQLPKSISAISPFSQQHPLTGQLTGVALLHALQLCIDGLCR